MTTRLDDLLRQRLAAPPRTWADTELRRAAVLCPIVALPAVDHVLFAVRPTTLRQHAGQIGFPGGMRDGDEDPVECALRECREEIGAPGGAITVLGSLGARESSTGILVHCLVGRLQPVPLVPHAGEVDRLLHVPLAQLLDDSRWHERTPPPTANGRQPPRSPHFEYGDDVIWGLTARFVRDLAAALRE